MVQFNAGDVAEAIAALQHVCRLPYRDPKAIIKAFERRGFRADTDNTKQPSHDKIAAGYWLVNQGLGDLKRIGRLRPNFYMLAHRWRKMP